MGGWTNRRKVVLKRCRGMDIQKERTIDEQSDRQKETIEKETYWQTGKQMNRQTDE